MMVLACLGMAQEHCNKVRAAPTAGGPDWGQGALEKNDKKQIVCGGGEGHLLRV